jgi:hypothetical protein
MFSISCCFLFAGLGVERPVQSNHYEEKGRRVRLSGGSVSENALVSSQIIDK